MIGSKDLYYWDANIFIAWLKDEKRPSGEMDGVREFNKKLEQRQIKIVTSTLMLAEILPCKFPVGVYGLFEDFLKRSNVMTIAVDRKIANLSRDIRAYYDEHPTEDSKTISTPDAIHLATAIIHNVTQFHTFDAGGKGKKHLGLLSLSGNVGGHNLTICKPPASQPGLDLG